MCSHSMCPSAQNRKVSHLSLVFVGQDVLFHIANYKVFFVALCHPCMDLDTGSVCYSGTGSNLFGMLKK